MGMGFFGGSPFPGILGSSRAGEKRDGSALSLPPSPSLFPLPGIKIPAAAATGRNSDAAFFWGGLHILGGSGWGRAALEGSPEGRGGVQNPGNAEDPPRMTG